ncbi:alkaline phosphatase family protein [Candidatus Micrarchaeota archaeon]|nr:alkaline phosphatase family protein [Candidatus Micrarchaeota archaeon]
MTNKIAIIGIDSLDPHVLKKYHNDLPNFSKLIYESPTFISKSVFPVDTIPAWSSIYTGFNPDRHGILYVYDIFDPKLSDLTKVDIETLKGKTFWDRAGKNDLRSVIVYPNLVYPAWKINGAMVSKSPFDRRIGTIETEVDIDTYPKELCEKYHIPTKMKSVWGGFPGNTHLNSWAEKAMDSLEEEKNIALSLFKNENWDIFFVYFSILDIIQHRLWRFFDESDPTYIQNELSNTIPNFYKKFDMIISEFLNLNPEVQLIIMSDHGHKIRPTKTVNINEHLRRNGLLISKNEKKFILGVSRKIILKTMNRFKIEHLMIHIISKNKRLIKAGKSIYSSTGSIDTRKSLAYLSTFAGIKSYSYGGININRERIPTDDYEQIRDELMKSISRIKNQDGKPIIKWIARREEKFKGEYAEKIYPEILFELNGEYCVGWDLNSDVFGKAYDHTVASGGHAKEAVILIKNISHYINRPDINIIDVAPTIYDLFEINYQDFDLDGTSILG